MSKIVEGLWVVEAIVNGKVYYRPRIATTQRGKKMAVDSCRRYARNLDYVRVRSFTLTDEKVTRE